MDGETSPGARSTSSEETEPPATTTISRKKALKLNGIKSKQIEPAESKCEKQDEVFLAVAGGSAAAAAASGGGVPTSFLLSGEHASQIESLMNQSVSPSQVLAGTSSETRIILHLLQQQQQFQMIIQQQQQQLQTFMQQQTQQSLQPSRKRESGVLEEPKKRSRGRTAPSFNNMELQNLLEGLLTQTRTSVYYRGYRWDELCTFYNVTHEETGEEGDSNSNLNYIKGKLEKYRSTLYASKELFINFSTFDASMLTDAEYINAMKKIFGSADTPTVNMYAYTLYRTQLPPSGEKEKSIAKCFQKIASILSEEATRPAHIPPNFPKSEKECSKIAVTALIGDSKLKRRSIE